MGNKASRHCKVNRTDKSARSPLTLLDRDHSSKPQYYWQEKEYTDRIDSLQSHPKVSGSYCTFKCSRRNQFLCLNLNFAQLRKRTCWEYRGFAWCQTSFWKPVREHERLLFLLVDSDLCSKDLSVIKRALRPNCISLLPVLILFQSSQRIDK